MCTLGQKICLSAQVQVREGGGALKAGQIALQLFYMTVIFDCPAPLVWHCPGTVTLETGLSQPKQLYSTPGFAA